MSTLDMRGVLERAGADGEAAAGSQAWALASVLTALERAAAAWQSLNSAESQISRINGYEYLTPAMKQDRARHAQTAAEARRTLNEVLRAPARELEKAA